MNKLGYLAVAAAGRADSQHDIVHNEPKMLLLKDISAS